jgi:hypothetical protein
MFPDMSEVEYAHKIKRKLHLVMLNDNVCIFLLQN